MESHLPPQLTMDASHQEQAERSPSLGDCLKLLKGDRDEQRLAGLLLVTKFCKGDDLASLCTIYDALGSAFLLRLLRTGMGKGIAGGSESGNREAYLNLAITVLAAFCRVPDIASSAEMISMIPLILEVMSQSTSPVLEECYEILYLLTASCKDGIDKFYETGGMKLIASQICTLPDGSPMMELAMKIVQFILNNRSQEVFTCSCLTELSMIVTSVARQFAVLHNHMKFEALCLLSRIFSSEYSDALHDALRQQTDGNCSDYMRAGIVAILHNRVAPAEKFYALTLAESMMSIRGETWLISQTNLPDLDKIPVDRCLLLVLESSRVEIAVLLNEMAYLKFEASKNMSSTDENILSKQRNIAVAFSLVERIIKLLSTIDGGEEEIIDEGLFVKVINGLNETITVVLEYLQDAKEHGQNKGNDLLASVRLLGSYLAETPYASEEKVLDLLEYLLTIQGEDEPSPFHSTCFMLPMVCQITMQTAGCKALISSGGHQAVVDCLIKLIGPSRSMAEENGSIFLACDTIMNVLLKMEQLNLPMDESTSINLLNALGHWAENVDDPSVLMMASSICSLILDHTSEAALLKHPNFDSSSINSLARVIARSLASWQGMSDAVRAEMDLLEIITSGYSRWADRFPHVKQMVERT
ncbi:hypothetical protein K2173_025902 [Erythroxylum novogranatense]|uniref:Neurochondrin n=1 Tax=Erythroxylum novogranatense TaxID=1862640 RepID=A0AAV8SIA9_9ROSI|nr:hypothetical protein K2173_025902 [Erythroxylum novogranatense]